MQFSLSCSRTYVPLLAPAELFFVFLCLLTGVVFDPFLASIPDRFRVPIRSRSLGRRFLHRLPNIRPPKLLFRLSGSAGGSRYREITSDSVLPNTALYFVVSGEGFPEARPPASPANRSSHSPRRRAACSGIDAVPSGLSPHSRMVVKPSAKKQVNLTLFPHEQISRRVLRGLVPRQTQPPRPTVKSTSPTGAVVCGA